MKTFILFLLFLASLALADPINVTITIPSLGISGAPASISGLGTKISAYPNVSLIQSNWLMVLADPVNHTNYNISGAELLTQIIANVQSNGNVFITLITSNLFATNIFTTNIYASTNFVTNLFATTQYVTNLNVVTNLFVDNINSFISTNITFNTNVTFVTNVTIKGNLNLTGLAANQFVTTTASSALTTTLNGATLTNLTYQYTTNPIPAAASLSFGLAYTTNLTRNITLPAFTISGNAFYETMVLQATNGDGADHTITFPGGVVGPPGSGTPAVLFCTNKQQTIILVSHYGLIMTNAWKQDFSP